MNILVIAHFQNDGSPTASFIHSQVKAIRQLGHEILVIVPIAIGKKDVHKVRFLPIVRCETIEDIEHIFVRYLSISRFGEKSFNSKSMMCSMTGTVEKKIMEFNPDIIHAHTIGFDSDIGKWVKKKIKKPLVVTTHGSDTFIPLRKGRQHWAEEKLKDVDSVVCVSSKIKAYLQDININNRLSVILNGYSVYDNNFKRKKKHLTLNQTGSLIERKKTDITIKSIAILKNKYPDIHLSIVGQGPKESILKGLCNDLNIQDNVAFMGQMTNTDVQQLMNETEFFVMPSIREGFGIVYLEAMAAGCLTIGTIGEGIADLIVSGENGFLVKPNSPEAIADTIMWCIENPLKTQEIANRGTQSAKMLTWENNAKQYLDLYSNLIMQDDDTSQAGVKK